ncbi:MAG: LamG domain-containing protein [Saprospiraceae bacterium]|nr:LamG domain-containing protein [Saprospiraceae bacterium]
MVAGPHRLAGADPSGQTTPSPGTPTTSRSVRTRRRYTALLWRKTVSAGRTTPLSFDGTQSYLEAPNNPALNSNYTTVAFWIKVNALPVSGEAYPLSFGGWQERWKISLPTHGKPVWTTNNSSGISDMDAGGGNELVAGAWTHVVFVHDGTNDLIYMDGVQVATKAVAGTMNSTTKPLGIGYNAVDGGNFL